MATHLRINLFWVPAQYWGQLLSGRRHPSR